MLLRQKEQAYSSAWSNCIFNVKADHANNIKSYFEEWPFDRMFWSTEISRNENRSNIRLEVQNYIFQS